MDVNVIVDAALIGATVLAGIGLILTYFSIRSNKAIIEANMVENIFRDIRTWEREKHTIADNDGQRKKEWADLFFLTLTWLGFLVINGKITDKKYIRFFKDAVLGWHDKIFLDSNYTDPSQSND